MAVGCGGGPRRRSGSGSRVYSNPAMKKEATISGGRAKPAKHRFLHKMPFLNVPPPIRLSRAC